MRNAPNIVCTNIFKNNDKHNIKNNFNKKFIEFINQIERNKNFTSQV